MNEHDVIRFIGRFPDKIIHDGAGVMKSKHWQCYNCQFVHKNIIEIRRPAPCSKCGGISFIKSE